jgi:hypothetical protein
MPRPGASCQSAASHTCSLILVTDCTNRTWAWAGVARALESQWGDHVRRAMLDRQHRPRVLSAGEHPAG